MADEGISSEVRRFVTDYIDSVETLEMLLLLYGRQSNEWSAGEVSRALRTSVESASKRLAELTRARLVSVTNSTPPKYKFAAETSGLPAIIAALDRTYRERRVSLISLIYSRPPRPIQAFSDAFRFRKEGK